jgi:hypothetical protein
MKLKIIITLSLTIFSRYCISQNFEGRVIYIQKYYTVENYYSGNKKESIREFEEIEGDTLIFYVGKGGLVVKSNGSEMKMGIYKSNDIKSYYVNSENRVLDISKPKGEKKINGRNESSDIIVLNRKCVSYVENNETSKKIIYYDINLGVDSTLSSSNCFLSHEFKMTRNHLPLKTIIQNNNFIIETTAIEITEQDFPQELLEPISKYKTPVIEKTFEKFDTDSIYVRHKKKYVDNIRELLIELSSELGEPNPIFKEAYKKMSNFSEKPFVIDIPRKLNFVSYGYGVESLDYTFVNDETMGSNIFGVGRIDIFSDSWHQRFKECTNFPLIFESIDSVQIQNRKVYFGKDKQGNFWKGFKEGDFYISYSDVLSEDIELFEKAIFSFKITSN